MLVPEPCHLPWGQQLYLILLLCLQQKCSRGHRGNLEDLLAGLCQMEGKKNRDGKLPQLSIPQNLLPTIPAHSWGSQESPG